MSRFRPWTKRVALGTGLVVLALAIFVWATIIPYREVDTVEYRSQKGFVAVEQDRALDRLIRRSQFDYWIAPTPGPGRCTLMYSAAFRRADELHLVFWAPRDSNNNVIYAFSYGTHKPLWKTQIGTEE